METSAHGITAPASVYEIAGRRFEIGTRGFAEAVADSHAAHQRPRCMCLVEGIEMYVARLGDGYIVKRMPDTGSHHAPDCPSYEPPAESSGLKCTELDERLPCIECFKLGFTLHQTDGACIRGRYGSK